MLGIENIKALYKKGDVVLTHHFIQRISKRHITLAHVKSAVVAGTIIEQYPSDYPHPSCLVLGNDCENKPLHIVIGVGGGYAWLITAYYPNNIKWKDDYKTRKA